MALDAAERSLAMRALLRLAVFRLVLPVVPFHRIRRYIDTRPLRAAPANSRNTALAVRRAMSRAARTLPACSCLAQALAAELLLRELGAVATLSIGVAEPGQAADSPKLDAHAWVVSGGLVVAGDGELERYRSLVSYGAPA
jgi:hypothetical protein